MTGDTTSRGAGTSQGEMGWIFFRGHALRAGGRRAPRMMPQCQGVSEGGGFPGEVAATARQEDPGHFKALTFLSLIPWTMDKTDQNLGKEDLLHFAVVP